MAEKISWDLLIDLANQNVNQSAEALAGVIRVQQEAESRLVTLERFHDDYLHSHAASARHGLTAEELKNQQLFMNRLHTAIRQQKSVLAHCASQADNARSAWQVNYMKLKSYGVLAKRVESQTVKDAGKREQRLLDEFSTRKFSATDSPLQDQQK
jgi:flagellar FliJ protein